MPIVANGNDWQARPFLNVFGAQLCAGKSQWAEHGDIKFFLKIIHRLPLI